MAIILATVLAPNTVWATSWWECDWHYRTEITAQSTLSANDRVVAIELSSSNFNSSYTPTPDGADLRVLSSDHATPLDFYLESWNATARSASLKVRIPALSANVPLTFFVYYGNRLVNSNSSAVPAISDVSATYPSSGWRYHTRQSTLNPSNEMQARAEFESAADVPSYGCSVINELHGRNNRNTFNGSRNNYGLYAETLFEVTTPGIWKFRSGIDFGRGGGFYINGTPLNERWNEDLWWSYNYSNSDVLSGSVFLEQGFHQYETLGFEGCCDGTISVQYQSPGTSIWKELNSENLNLATAGCPVGVQSATFVQTDSPNRFGGQVFLDNGDDGIAHNGLLEGNESGMAGIDITVEITNSGETSTVSSQSDGSWHACFFEDAVGSDIKVSVPIPPDHYNVSESASAANNDLPLNAILQFPVADNSNYLNINTGFVESPILVSDNAIQVGAGFTGLLSHQYSSTSDASVNFQVSEIQHQLEGSYTYLVFQDIDCNGQMDNPAVPMNNPIATQAGQSVCLVIKVDGASSVTTSSLLELRIDAITAFNGIDLSHTSTNIDYVSGEEPVLLVLNKTVCNADAQACDLESGVGFTTNIEGRPDDELVYRLEFSSLVKALNNVTVYDNIPSYTTFKPSSMSVVSLPTGVNCTIVEPVDQNIANFTGPIKWQCSGELQSSNSGVVAFSVLID